MLETKPCIQITNLQLDLSGKPVYRNLNLKIANGTLAALVGRNSAAWNILLHMLAGIKNIHEGTIELWGAPISQIGRRELGSLVGFMPRSQQPLFAYPVMDFILQGCEARLKPMQAPQASDRDKARQIIESLKISRLVNRDCSLLNNAEHTLVLLARALMQDARLMLLDEPVLNLPEAGQYDVMKILLDLAHQQGKTVLVTLADPALALRLADQLAVFDDQSIAAVLYRQQPDFYDAAEYVLRRLLPLDQDCHLLDPLKIDLMKFLGQDIGSDDEIGKEKPKPPKPPSGGWLF